MFKRPNMKVVNSEECKNLDCDNCGETSGSFVRFYQKGRGNYIVTSHFCFGCIGLINQVIEKDYHVNRKKELMDKFKNRNKNNKNN